MGSQLGVLTLKPRDLCMRSVEARLHRGKARTFWRRDGPSGLAVERAGTNDRFSKFCLPVKPVPRHARLLGDGLEGDWEPGVLMGPQCASRALKGRLVALFGRRSQVGT